jgi:hypothetical protein
MSDNNSKQRIPKALCHASRRSRPLPQSVLSAEGACAIAICHLSIKIISRGKGKPAAAAAACRAGITLCEAAGRYLLLLRYFNQNCLRRRVSFVRT